MTPCPSDHGHQDSPPVRHPAGGQGHERRRRRSRRRETSPPARWRAPRSSRISGAMDGDAERTDVGHGLGGHDQREDGPAPRVGHPACSSGTGRDARDYGLEILLGVHADGGLASLEDADRDAVLQQAELLQLLRALERSTAAASGRSRALRAGRRTCRCASSRRRLRARRDRRGWAVARSTGRHRARWSPPCWRCGSGLLRASRGS